MSTQWSGRCVLSSHGLKACTQESWPVVPRGNWGKKLASKHARTEAVVAKWAPDRPRLCALKNATPTETTPHACSFLSHDTNLAISRVRVLGTNLVLSTLKNVAHLGRVTRITALWYRVLWRRERDTLYLDYSLYFVQFLTLQDNIANDVTSGNPTWAHHVFSTWLWCHIRDITSHLRKLYWRWFTSPLLVFSHGMTSFFFFLDFCCESWHRVHTGERTESDICWWRDFLWALRQKERSLYHCTSNELHCITSLLLGFLTLLFTPRVCLAVAQLFLLNILRKKKINKKKKTRWNRVFDAQCKGAFLRPVFSSPVLPPRAKSRAQTTGTQTTRSATGRKYIMDPKPTTNMFPFSRERISVQEFTDQRALCWETHFFDWKLSRAQNVHNLIPKCHTVGASISTRNPDERDKRQITTAYKQTVNNFQNIQSAYTNVIKVSTR